MPAFDRDQVKRKQHSRHGPSLNPISLSPHRVIRGQVLGLQIFANVNRVASGASIERFGLRVDTAIL
jgi:hypothetical protein